MHRKPCIKGEGWPGCHLSLQGNVCHLLCPFLGGNVGCCPCLVQCRPINASLQEKHLHPCLFLKPQSHEHQWSQSTLRIILWGIAAIPYSQTFSIRLTLLSMNLHSSEIREVPVSCEMLLLAGLCEAKLLLDTSFENLLFWLTQKEPLFFDPIWLYSEAASSEIFQKCFLFFPWVS